MQASQDHRAIDIVSWLSKDAIPVLPGHMLWLVYPYPLPIYWAQVDAIHLLIQPGHAMDDGIEQCILAWRVGPWEQELLENCNAMMTRARSLADARDPPEKQSGFEHLKLLSQYLTSDGKPLLQIPRKIAGSRKWCKIWMLRCHSWGERWWQRSNQSHA